MATVTAGVTLKRNTELGPERKSSGLRCVGGSLAAHLGCAQVVVMTVVRGGGALVMMVMVVVMGTLLLIKRLRAQTPDSRPGEYTSRDSPCAWARVGPAFPSFANAGGLTLRACLTMPASVRERNVKNKSYLVHGGM